MHDLRRDIYHLFPNEMKPEFYEDEKANTFTIEIAQKESFFSPNGEPFYRVRFKIHHKIYGVFEIDYFSPHRELHETTDPIVDKAFGLTDKGQVSDTELVVSLGTSLNKIFGNDSFQYLADTRNLRGSVEHMAFLKFHAGGNPWFGAVGLEEDQTYLGKVQDLVDEFEEGAASQGYTYDRLILLACNTHAQVVKTKTMKINFTTDVAGGGHRARPVEWNPETQTWYNKLTYEKKPISTNPVDVQ